MVGQQTEENMQDSSLIDSSLDEDASIPVPIPEEPKVHSNKDAYLKETLDPPFEFGIPPGLDPKPQRRSSD